MVVHLSLSLTPPTRLNPSNPPSQLGRLTHFAFDAVLVSAFLAGVKRSTGLTYVLGNNSTLCRLFHPESF